MEEINEKECIKQRSRWTIRRANKRKAEEEIEEMIREKQLLGNHKHVLLNEELGQAIASTNIWTGSSNPLQANPSLVPSTDQHNMHQNPIGVNPHTVSETIDSFERSWDEESQDLLVNENLVNVYFK